VRGRAVSSSLAGAYHVAMLVRTLRRFWSTSLASELEYRINFITSALYSAGQLIGSIFTINVLYAQNYQFGVTAHDPGWSKEAAYLVIAIFSILDGITSAALSPNLSRIVGHVQRGTLDFILLKPLDAQVQLSTRNLSPWGFPNLIFGLALGVYAGVRLGLPGRAYPLGLAAVLLSIVILYSLWYMVATTTIWFTKVWNATEVLRAFVDAGKYPMSAYPLAVRFFLTFILPIAFLTTVPAELMRGIRGPLFLAIEAAIAVVTLFVSRIFWDWAMRYYTSASS
jgi:ABC-2 type transport system permease protein